MWDTDNRQGKEDTQRERQDYIYTEGQTIERREKVEKRNRIGHILEKLTRSQRQGTQTSGNMTILSQWWILKHEGQPLNQSSGFKLLFCLLPHFLQ